MCKFRIHSHLHLYQWNRICTYQGQFSSLRIWKTTWKYIFLSTKYGGYIDGWGMSVNITYNMSRPEHLYIYMKEFMSTHCYSELDLTYKPKNWVKNKLTENNHSVLLISFHPSSWNKVGCALGKAFALAQHITADDRSHVHSSWLKR